MVIPEINDTITVIKLNGTCLMSILQKTKINTDINPDEAIAYGAAVQGAILAGDKSEQVMI